MPITPATFSRQYADLLGKPVLAATKAVVTHQVLTAYDSTTGAFSQAQLAESDISGLTSDLALKSPLASPTFTGVPAAPTAAALTNTTQIATTAYADAAVSAEATLRTTAVALKAPLASPALTGHPTGVTELTADSSTRLATTALVDAKITASAGGLAPVQSVAGKTGTVTLVEGDITNLTSDLALKAPLASPALTGSPVAPTATALDNSTKLATTAYADAAVAVEVSARTTAVALKANTSSLATVATSGSYTDLTSKPQLAVTNAGGAHNFLTAYDSATGLFTKAQPAASDVTGLATVATSGSYADLSSKPTLAATKAAVSTKFLTAYDSTTGAFTNGQPAASDVTGLATVATSGSYTDLSSKPTLAATIASATSNYLTSYDSTTGAFTKAQPNFTDLAGSISAGQIASGLLTWDKLGNAAGALTIANGTNATTFNQTNAATWTWANTTAATSAGATSSSPINAYSGTYYTAGASAVDTWTIKTTIAAAKTFAVTNISESAGSVVTLTISGGTFIAGESVTFTGFTTGTWLNGQNATLTTASATTLTFTDPTSHGTQASHADVGTVVQANPLSQLVIGHSGTPAPTSTSGILSPSVSIPGYVGATGPNLVSSNSTTVGVSIADSINVALSTYSSADCIRFYESSNKNIIGGILYQPTAKALFMGTYANSSYTTLCLGPVGQVAASVVPNLTFRTSTSITAGYTSTASNITAVSFGSIDGVIPVTGGNVVGGAITWSPASGTTTFTAVNINPIINQGGGTGTYTALKVNVTETAYLGGSTASSLLDLQVGQTSKFKIDRLGNETTTGAAGETVVYGSATELLTLSTGGLTTDTAANLLPVGAIIQSVVCRVTTTITTTTNWAVGDATISNRFSSANSTLTSGTTSVGLNHIGSTGTSGPAQTAAAKVRITCTGSNPGAGVIRITVNYIQYTAPTS